MREMQELENKWYESLRTGAPWYGVYSADYYIADLWACWVVYSRKYLLSIMSPKSLDTGSIYNELIGIKSFCDLGCGIGITTSAMKEMFPSSKAYGTNILGSQQSDFAIMMSRKYGFTLVQQPSDISGEIDFIFASEYFEHFYKPVEHLREVLRLKPKYMLIANAFGSKSIGHFPVYFVDGDRLDGKKTSKAFNDELRKNGYEKVKTNLWNNRPSYWRKY